MQNTSPPDNKPAVPRFDVAYMDLSTDPREDFYQYSIGKWVRANPVPADQSSWTSFNELYEWNLYLLREILEQAAKQDISSTNRRLLGDFYKSLMNTERIDELGFSPVRDLLQRVEGVKQTEDLARCIAELRFSGIDSFFTTYSTTDKKNSSIYALYLDQGGLSLPDKEYYLAESFAEVRHAYQDHVTRMFRLAEESDEESKRLAEIVLEIETSLARSSRARADLRDEEKNYNKTATLELDTRFPSTHFSAYLKALGAAGADYVVIGQPEFFTALDGLLSKKPMEDLRAYLRWGIIHAYAPFLHKAVESEDFEFFHRKLEGQEEQEARWKIAVHTVDGLVGEALGELYVEKYFPPDAKSRLVIMIEDIKQVFADRLRSLPWMTEETRKQALAKFERFNTKIGHPERFRDYSSVKIEPQDLVGNIRRASEFEVKRQSKRVGRPVDKSEWFMTPPTVNAYFSPTENEIVFPAGILQPPFFDVKMDDAVNYATIGAVIAHEITHGYDDQGRKYDAEGNLRDWWVSEDEKEFQSRAKSIVELYGSQEPLPGMPINGELTLGENIADFGGISLAYEALQRRLDREPEKKLQKIDGLTPDQRFFIAWAQMWRGNMREEELRRRLTIDPHSPVRYRAILPAMNHLAFDAAFPQNSGDKKSDAPRQRVVVW